MFHIQDDFLNSDWSEMGGVVSIRRLVSFLSNSITGLMSKLIETWKRP